LPPPQKPGSPGAWPYARAVAVLAASTSFKVYQLVELVTDPNALSVPPKITAEEVGSFALAGGKVILNGGVGRMIEMARSNLRNIPRP
jgi:pyruvate dehydrogenase (quinone)